MVVLTVGAIGTAVYFAFRNKEKEGTKKETILDEIKDEEDFFGYIGTFKSNSYAGNFGVDLEEKTCDMFDDDIILVQQLTINNDHTAIYYVGTCFGEYEENYVWQESSKKNMT